MLFIAYTRSSEPHSTTTLNEVLGALYKSLEKSPGNIDIRIMLSGALQKAGEFDKSIAVARKTLEDEPDSGLALYYLGTSLYDLGHLDEAERTLIRAEEVLPEESGIVYMLAKVVEAKGDLTRAQDIFSRYKLLNPLFP